MLSRAKVRPYHQQCVMQYDTRANQPEAGQAVLVIEGWTVTGCVKTGPGQPSLQTRCCMVKDWSMHLEGLQSPGRATPGALERCCREPRSSLRSECGGHMLRSTGGRDLQQDLQDQSQAEHQKVCDQVVAESRRTKGWRLGAPKL